MELDVENALNIGEDEFYRALRYKIPLSVILINSEDKDAFKILEINSRTTDILQQITSTTAIIYLAHTDHNDSTKFIQKLKTLLHFTYTVGQFKSSQQSFLENLFLQNSTKLSFD